MWKFEGREAYDRRVYFWNLMAGVLWQVGLYSQSLLDLSSKLLLYSF